MSQPNKPPVIEPVEEIIKIPVYLPDTEVKQFLIFQQYFEPFSALLEAKVFEQKNATIQLDFDHLGHLAKIRRSDILWKSGN